METGKRWLQKPIIKISIHIGAIILSGFIITISLSPVICHIKEAKQPDSKVTVIANCVPYSAGKEIMTGAERRDVSFSIPDNHTIRALHIPGDVIWLLVAAIGGIGFYRLCQKLMDILYSWIKS